MILLLLSFIKTQTCFDYRNKNTLLELHLTKWIGLMVPTLSA